jgi:hypothetical protein
MQATGRTAAATAPNGSADRFLKIERRPPGTRCGAVAHLFFTSQILIYALIHAIDRPGFDQKQ